MPSLVSESDSFDTQPSSLTLPSHIQIQSNRQSLASREAVLLVLQQGHTKDGI